MPTATFAAARLLPFSLRVTLVGLGFFEDVQAGRGKPGPASQATDHPCPAPEHVHGAALDQQQQDVYRRRLVNHAHDVNATQDRCRSVATAT
jgi:hypothetical protein